MRNTWRWFGPNDGVGLMQAYQAGARGIVSALHHLPAGQVWSSSDVKQRQDDISQGSQDLMQWEVVESLPVAEAFKTKAQPLGDLIKAYQDSMRAIADVGIETLCYNFMPVLDWTRTDLRWPLKSGALAMRFDLIHFAVFDCFILKREGAKADYEVDQVIEAERAFKAMSEDQRMELVKSIVAGLPGAAESWDLESLHQAMAAYRGIGADEISLNHIDFLCEMAPLAEKLGLRLCCHPDDPPFSLMGLPRVMSSAAGYAKVLDAVGSPNVGMTFCTGSLGASPNNDCVAIAEQFADRIFFAHLRNVRRDSHTLPCSFYEDEHLEGQVDFVATIKVLLKEEARRRAKGRSDHEIPMRPDHGQEILSDIGANYQPGYPAVGRLKGLAEIKGIAAALNWEIV